MKQDEIENCANCGQGLMHNNQLHFYRVKVQQLIFDTGAIQRAHGLEMAMGGAGALAQIMGPNEDIAKSLSDGKTILMCGDCGMSGNALPIAVLIEDRD